MTKFCVIIVGATVGIGVGAGLGGGEGCAVEDPHSVA